MKLIPRNDFVVYRTVLKTSFGTGNLTVPQNSPQAKHHYVEAIGPDVVNLSIGDKILVIGSPGSLAPLPHDPYLFITRQENIVMVVVEDE